MKFTMNVHSSAESIDSVETTSTHVYIRADIVKNTDTDGNSYYSYNEISFTTAEYAMIKEHSEFATVVNAIYQ